MNDGWRTAITTLMNERVSLGAGGDPDQEARVEALFGLARLNGRYDDPAIRDRLAKVYSEHTIIGLIGQRIRDAVLRGVDPRAGRIYRQTRYRPLRQGPGGAGCGYRGGAGRRVGQRRCAQPDVGQSATECTRAFHRGRRRRSAKKYRR